MLDGANPVFTAPKAWRVREALEKVPYIVSFGSFLDETSGLADLILPDHSFLESWAESVPESGSLVAVASVAPPAMAPLHQTRATADVLARRQPPPADAARAAVGDRWRRCSAPRSPRCRRPPKAATRGARRRRRAAGGARCRPRSSAAPPAAARREPGTGDVRRAAVRRRPGEVPVPLPAVRVDHVLRRLHRAPAVAAGDAGSADVRDVEQLGGDQSARRRPSWGSRDGDLVDVTSAHGTLRSSAVLTPGIAPDIVAMPMGQGHTQFTRYATGRGENPVEPAGAADRAVHGRRGLGGHARDRGARRRSRRPPGALCRRVTRTWPRAR